ncbi:serine hydrolase domain-containing protein [Planctobacterium marinum]|uniref:Beta-lactamase-related domain-containing protein n=1 Tax=Planctobacterium marinum TaxID=1631968 RepID=A0AA48HZ35_9ALTE|nr:hypothetical protein MACH26_40090 [Planctobacterium marinum]
MLKQLTLISMAVLGLSACGGGSSETPITPVTPPPPPPTQPTSEFAAVAEAARAELQSNQSAAVSVAVYKDGEVVYAEAFGNNQWQNGDPVNANTLFQLGSTTKMFTSLATMQLVEQGIVTTEDTLTSTLPDIRYLAEQSQSWNDVNIHHLMTHQNGFLDDYQAMSDNSELMRYMQQQYGNANPKMVAPGKFFNYNNPGFSYLGAILEHVEAQDFRDVMAQSVFEPLGMSRTTMHQSDVGNDGNFALGVYSNEDGTPVGYTSLHQVQDWLPIIPAGIYTWSTPTELLQMADFLINGNNDVLADEYRTEITKAQVSMEQAGLPLNYGYGIFIDEGFAYNNRWYPMTVWQHGGNTEGYTSMFWVLPEENIAVSIMSSGYSDYYIETMVAALQSVMELPTPQAMPYGEIDTDNFDRHVGTYNTGAVTIEVSNKDGVLHVNVPEMNAQNVPYSPTLQAIGGNTFLATADGDITDLTFFADEVDGDSNYIRNRNYVAIRVGSETSERPAAAKQLRTTSATSKIILD